MLEDQLNDFGYLVGDRVFLTNPAGAPQDELVGDALVASDAWERGEGPVIQARLSVGEGDQSLVPGAVVPAEGAGPTRRWEQCAHDIED